jgi:hypothetical protein
MKVSLFLALQLKDMDIEKLRFPIGEFQLPTSVSMAKLAEWKKTIEKFPYEISRLTKDLGIDALNYRYRPDGWTIQKVVHHCADSHMNGFIRHKLTLTEDTPTIKPYNEVEWTEMQDVQLPIAHSLAILKGVHTRWTSVLNAVKEAELTKEYIHPEHGMNFSLYQSIANYAWHCEHHLAHIKNALETKYLY